RITLCVEISAVTPPGVIGTGNYIEKKPYLVSGCRKYTVSTTGCCLDHSGRFHSLNYRMRQKYGAEAFNPKSLKPQFPNSLGRNLTDSIRVKILGDRVVIKGSAPESPRIYEAPVSESDDEWLARNLEH
ncbi:10816_t:CDS:2, partial [Acaulospora morrowiae]